MDHKDMVIFSPEKHKNFVKLADLDKPVEIERPRLTHSRYQPETTEVIVGGNTDVYFMYHIKIFLPWALCRLLVYIRLSIH